MAGTLALYGCNSGSSSSSSSSTTNASAAGIWSGTDSASGLTLIGFVNSAGSADFIRSDGVQYVGTVQVSGSTLAATLDGYTNFGAEFSGGSTYGIGTLNATVTSSSSISGTLSFTPSGGSTTSSTWTLSFESLYNSGSSLGAISGTYTDALGGDVLSGSSVTISSGGAIYGQGSTNGCVLNGSVTAGNSSYDVYEISYEYSSCTGTDASLNGVQFTGLAVLVSNRSPMQVDIGVTGQSAGGTNYGLFSALDRS
jgi:hypothetical protein